MALYRPLTDEGIFDVAVKLYKHFYFGVADILRLNPNINIDDTDLFGEEITYTESPIYPSNVTAKPISISRPSEYLTKSYQNVYDLAVQVYGDISKIGILLELFPNLDVSINLSSSIMVDDQADPIAKYFKDKRIVVSTDVFVAPLGGGAILREDGSYLLREDGFHILRET
jgi:hypothetical protein